MTTRPENCWTDYYVVEGKDGEELWFPKFTDKVNPYTVKKNRSAATWENQAFIDKWAKREGRVERTRRTGPDEVGYTWEMGYNHLVGRTTQGRNRKDLYGSSLNRKKNVKMQSEDVPAEKDAVISVAMQAAIKYCNRTGRVLMEWEGGREHVGTLLQRVIVEAEQGDILSARGLALRFRASLRELPRRLSFGVRMLSTRSRGKIKDKATAFYRACPGNRVFCTLTFIAPVDDRTGQSILNKFFTQARKEFKKLHYFWVAERQDNGNIHFHIILNKRLPVGRWNALWVLAQYNAGLVGKDFMGNDISKTTMLQAYYKDYEEGFKKKRVQGLLNPLDIKKVRSISGLNSYLTKYITKQKKNEPFNCAVWHCSRGVSRLFTRQTVSPSTFRYMTSLANVNMNKQTGEVFARPSVIRPKRCPFVVLVYVLDKSIPLRYLKRLEQVNKWILEDFQPDRITEYDDDGYTKFFICQN